MDVDVTVIVQTVASGIGGLSALTLVGVLLRSGIPWLKETVRTNQAVVDGLATFGRQLKSHEEQADKRSAAVKEFFGMRLNGDAKVDESERRAYLAAMENVSSALRDLNSNLTRTEQIRAVAGRGAR